MIALRRPEVHEALELSPFQSATTASRTHGHAQKPVPKDQWSQVPIASNRLLGDGVGWPGWAKAMSIAGNRVPNVVVSWRCLGDSPWSSGSAAA
jgi:hypothetical protein